MTTHETFDPPNLVRKERNTQMLVDREGGMTLKQVGERYGLSRERVRQIVDRELWNRGKSIRLLVTKWELLRLEIITIYQRKVADA